MAYLLDGSRPTLANMFTFGDLLSDTIDVQGFSHQSRAKLKQCHAKLPHKVKRKPEPKPQPQS